MHFRGQEAEGSKWLPKQSLVVEGIQKRLGRNELSPRNPPAAHEVRRGEHPSSLFKRSLGLSHLDSH